MPASILGFFASVRLSIFLLLILAATSILGTVIPQGQPMEVYLSQYSPLTCEIFSRLEIFDMFGAWWFLALLVLLTVNLVVCSAKRLPSTWKVVRMKNPGFRKALFEKLPNKQSFVMGASTEAALAGIEKKLSGRFRYITAKRTETGFTLYAEKGRWTRLGPYVIHLGILLVLAGALLGSLYGFTANTSIPVGQTRDHAINKHGKNESIHLPFAIRCDDFSISRYPDDSVKEYRSTLTILEKGKPPFTRDIIVNDPLRYKGINLFQANWGYESKIELKFTDAKTGEAHLITAPLGDRLALPHAKGQFLISDYSPTSEAHGRDLGPRVHMHVFPLKGSPVNVNIFANFPEFDKQRGGDFVISAEGINTSYFTGIQVTRDPGVDYVYAGFILIIAGCFISFFISHQRLYFNGEKQAGKTLITLAPDATRNRQGFVLTAKKLAGELKGLETKVKTS